MMIKSFSTLFALLLLTLEASNVSAFGIGAKKASTKVPMPTFDKETQTWTKSPADDGVYPYDAVGAALRHGPAPFIARITNPKQYEQGVLKYMAVEKVSRAEAVGNCDARFNNPSDWAFQKMEEKKGKAKVDYTRLDKKQAALTVVWAVFITPLAASVVIDTVTQFITSPGASVINGGL